MQNKEIIICIVQMSTRLVHFKFDILMSFLFSFATENKTRNTYIQREVIIALDDYIIRTNIPWKSLTEFMTEVFFHNFHLVKNLLCL